jgi:transposase
MQKNRCSNDALTSYNSLVSLANGYLIGALTPYGRIPVIKAVEHEAFFKHLNVKSMDKSMQKSKRIATFAVVHPNAAGIDVSDTSMLVAVSPDRVKENVKTFGCFTCDLLQIVYWLKECEIETVAMESTGVYWVQLFLLLQEYGFEVYLVNAKHVKNVTGRKKDDSDAAWIQKLHSCGLLSNSFQPDEQTRALRNLVRHRKVLVRDAARYLNRIQKVMELMNIKLHTVISDIAGRSGQDILRAILSGERDAERLASLCDSRIKAKHEEIVKSLQGYWRDEYLFELDQSYQMYQFLHEKIHNCDMEIEKQLTIMAKTVSQEEPLSMDEKIKRKKNTKNQPCFNVTAYLKAIVGVDVTEITGISEISALEIFSETGFDLSKWKRDKAFTSWLGSAPNTKESNNKVISSRILKKKHHAGQAFKMAASSLHHSKSPLGDFYRRIRARAGAGKATVATARKIAVIFYHMVTEKTNYNPEKLVKSQQQYKDYKIKMLEKQLAKLKAA